MRVFACALAASLMLCTGAEAAPHRVASLKLCTDEILLALAEPSTIASVTHLSRNPQETALWRTARRYRPNDGSLLSVASQRPDLVFDMGGGARDAQRIATRLGIRLVMLPYPLNIGDMKRMIRIMASELGRQQKGEALVRGIERLERTAPAGKDAIWLGGGGRSVAAKGLAADWMRLAGLTQRRLQGDRASLEGLLVSPPAIILRSDYRQNQYSGDQRWLSHPLARGKTKSRILPTDGRRWTCMGPSMIGEVERLRREVAR